MLLFLKVLCFDQTPLLCFIFTLVVFPSLYFLNGNQTLKFSHAKKGKESWKQFLFSSSLLPYISFCIKVGRKDLSGEHLFPPQVFNRKISNQICKNPHRNRQFHKGLHPPAPGWDELSLKRHLSPSDLQREPRCGARQRTAFQDRCSGYCTAHPHLGLLRKSFGCGWQPHALGSLDTRALVCVSGWSSVF